MRTVYRDSFARHTVLAERIHARGRTCSWCGQVRGTVTAPWLYRFHVEPDDRPRPAPIADGKLFCSRTCCETFTDQPFNGDR